MENIINEFKSNKFDPSSPTPLPDKSGNYLFCLKENSKLPEISIAPTMSEFEGLQVVYTGISKSLQKRDSQQHFRGNAQGSTVRWSFCALMGFKKEYYYSTRKNKDSTKKKQEKWRYEEEKKYLSDWMKDNLIMYFREANNPIEIEGKLINHFNPPLNLKDNTNEINKNYRAELTKLRNSK